jgi:hypothetical protein
MQSGWELRVGPDVMNNPTLLFASCTDSNNCDEVQRPATPGWHRVYAFRTIGGITLALDGAKPFPIGSLFGTPRGSSLRVGATPNAVVDELYLWNQAP